MEVGQVGFHNEKAVKKGRVAKKDNAIINRLNKTKTVVQKPNLQSTSPSLFVSDFFLEQQEDRLREIRKQEAAAKAQAKYVTTNASHRLC